MNWVKKAWRGEEKLWKVFWIYGYVLPILIGLALWFVIKNVLSADIVQKIIGIYSKIIDFYYVLWSICAWRCATNVKEKSWILAVRICVVFTLLAIFMTTINSAGINN